MPETRPQVRSVPVPRDSRVARFHESTDLADAYEIRLPSNAVSAQGGACGLAEVRHDKGFGR